MCYTSVAFRLTEHQPTCTLNQRTDIPCGWSGVNRGRHHNRRHLPSGCASAYLSAAGVLHCGLLLCLAIMLPLGATASGHIWRGGGHATPQQWTAHLLLVERGILDHHPASGFHSVLWAAEGPIASTPNHQGTYTAELLLLIGVIVAPLVPPSRNRLTGSVDGLLPDGTHPTPPSRPPRL